MNPSNMGNESISTKPEPTVYKVGDTIKIINRGYNVDLFRENDNYLPKGCQIIEVEVKEVKIVKLIIE